MKPKWIQVSATAWVYPHCVRAVEDADRNDEYLTRIHTAVGNDSVEILSTWTPQEVLDALKKGVRTS